MRKPVLAAGLALVWTLSGAASFAAAQAVSGTTTSPGTDPTIVVKGERAPLTRRRNAEWFRAESQHFVVYSDTTHKDVALLLGRLERFRYILRSYLRQDTTADEAPEPKLEIYYLSHEQDLEIANPSGPAYSIGLYQSCEDGTQAYAVHMYYDGQPGAALEKQPENEGLSYIFEAYARHYLYQNSYNKQPTWFIDGFAHYFSTMRFEGNQAIVGLAPEAMAKQLQRLGNSQYYSLDYKDILRQQETNGHNYIGVDGVKAEYQVRSWILTHYILSTPENRQKYRVYVQAIEGGQDPLKAFETTFGMKASQISNELWKYRRTHLEALKLNFKALPEADISFFALPESADKLLMWQSALEACPSKSYGASLLSKIRSEAPKFPDSELAQRTLSRAEAIWGDPKAALPYLTKATTETPEDFEGLYLLGRAQLSLAQKSTGDARMAALKAARTALAKASTLDAKSAATAWYYYRTVVLETGKPDEDAQAAALIAWQQAPEIDTYALHAGLVYAYLGRKDEALQALKTVADNPRGRELQPVAQAWMTKVQAGADPASLLAAMQADYPAPKGGLGEWTIATADVVKAVKDAADAEDAAAALSSADPAEEPQVPQVSNR